VRLTCPFVRTCGTTADLDLETIHPQDRVCWQCKSPWIPEGYDGALTTVNTTITPDQAWEWMQAIPDDSGHWILGDYGRFARRYAGLMRSGVWEVQLIGHPGAVEHAITFDPHGHLLIGVIRLVACIDVDTPFDAVLRTFDPIVPGHVPFQWGYNRKASVSLLNHWRAVKDRRCSKV